MNLQSVIDGIVESLSTKTVIGEPMEIQGLTLIPVMHVSFGFGGGNDGRSGGKGDGSGTGAGGGARLKAAGVLVVKDGDVKFVQTAKGGAFDKLADLIPDLVDKVNVKNGKPKEKGEA